MPIKLFFSYGIARAGLTAAGGPDAANRCESLATVTAEFGGVSTSEWPNVTGGDVNNAARIAQATEVGQRWVVSAVAAILSAEGI